MPIRRLLWLLPIGFFFLNPSFACTSDPDYQFGAAEMRAAVEGDWGFTITPAGGSPAQVRVRIAQSTQAPGASASTHPSGPVRAAFACGSRTLIAGAGACTEVTDMPLALSFVDGDATLAGAPLSGMFMAYGLVFSRGSLQLTIGPYQILADVLSDGSLIDPHLGPLGTAGTLVVTRS